MGIKKIRLSHIVAVALGLLIAVVLIHYLNKSITIDACLDHGGRYIAEQQHCVDPVTNYEHSLKPTAIMLTGYALLVLIIPLLCKRLVDAFVIWRQKSHHSK